MIEQTTSGGKQSKIDGLPTLIPPYALAEISKVMKEGSKYGVGNWHKIPIIATQSGDSVDAGEIDHALEHCYYFLIGHGDPLEQLSHFAARAMMALDQYIRENNPPACEKMREKPAEPAPNIRSFEEMVVSPHAKEPKGREILCLK